MKIIVLTINQYKEKDAIITAISETETLTFLARGILNPKSKNAALNNPLTIADVELMEGNFKHPILKSSKVLSSPLRIDMDTYYLGAILFLNEMMVNLFPEEDQYKMFAHLEMAIDNLKNKKNWLITVLLFMNEAIKVGGFQLQANQCVLCGKRQNIVSFSFREGGFICRDCYQDDMERDLSKAQMYLLRELINSKDQHLFDKECDEEDLKVIFTHFIDYMQEVFGYSFKNLRLLISEK